LRLHGGHQAVVFQLRDGLMTLWRTVEGCNTQVRNLRVPDRLR